MENPQTSSTHKLESASSSAPECCNSGCRFCVLDYPELFLPSPSAPADLAVESSDTCEADLSHETEMLKALERAERILTYLDSEGEP